MTTASLDLEQAHDALAALPKRDRDEVLSLPANEALAIIRLLLAFPGSHFVHDTTTGRSTR